MKILFHEDPLLVYHDYTTILYKIKIVILKVGVTCTRFVSLNNARPWVIHAYRNIKGRGLHVDPEAENTAPIDKVDETDITSLTPDPHPYLYTEPVAGKTTEDSKDEKEVAKQGTKGTEEKDITSTSTTDNSDADHGNASKPGYSEVTSESEIPVKRRRVDASEIDDKTPTSNTDVENSKSSETITSSSNTNEEQRTDKNIEVSESVNTVNTNTSNDLNTNKNVDDQKEEQAKAGENDATDNTKETDDKSSNSNKVETKRVRKRKNPDMSKPVEDELAPSISTYDKVRLVIQPWRKPEGSINKPILKMMMESIMLFLMMNPGSPEEALVKRYAPYIQPMILRNIVDILEDIGCVTREYFRKRKVTIFSKPKLPEIGGIDDEDSIVHMLPTEDCVIKMGLFGQEVFPHAKWPETTHPKTANTSQS